MKWRLHFSIVIGFLCAIFLSNPAPAAERSLLQAWAFAHYRGAIPFERLQTDAHGAITPPSNAENSGEETNYWTVIDDPNFILRSGTSSITATDYYLNNISRIRPTVYKSDGTFHIGLMGDQPIRCQIENSNKQCDHFFILRVEGADRYHAVIQALDGIYANFCKYSR